MPLCPRQCLIDCYSVRWPHEFLLVLHGRSTIGIRNRVAAFRVGWFKFVWSRSRDASQPSTGGAVVVSRVSGSNVAGLGRELRTCRNLWHAAAIASHREFIACPATRHLGTAPCDPARRNNVRGCPRSLPFVNFCRRYATGSVRRFRFLAFASEAIGGRRLATVAHGIV